MPVTKTAKRALRVSKRKEKENKTFKARLEIAIRLARKSKKKENILKAISLVDRSVKKKLFHKNKAARIKSALSKLLPRESSKKSTTSKKSSPKKMVGKSKK